MVGMTTAVLNGMAETVVASVAYCVRLATIELHVWIVAFPNTPDNSRARLDLGRKGMCSLR